MRTRVVIALLGLALLASCKKEDLLRHHMSGVYNVTSIDQEFYVAGTLDSTTSYDGYGFIGLYNNDGNPYNNISDALDWEPLSWFHQGVGTSGRAVGWYTDEADGSTITFFSQNDFGYFWAVFTVDKPGKKEQVWTYVENDAAGRMSYKETWKVRRE